MILYFYLDEKIPLVQPVVVNQEIGTAECIEVTEGDCNVLLHQRQFSFMLVEAL